MNDDYAGLDDVDKDRIDAAIALARRSGKLAKLQFGAVEYFAQPQGDAFAWHIDGGWFVFNPKIGVRA